MSENFLLPIVYQCDKYEELHFLQDRAPSHLALPVPGWLDNHLLCGLDVENQQNGLREISIAIHIISIRAFGPNKMSTDENQEHSKNWKRKFEILCHCSSALLKEKC